MTDSPTIAAVEQALATVMEPELHRDIVSLHMVKDVHVEGGAVSVRIVLTTPACPLTGRIEGDIRSALMERVPGVESVTVAWDSNVTSGARGLPGRQEIPGVKNTVAVSAGKGGVGKTTVSVNVAIALAQAGARVGLLDADIYGPNVPIMMGLRDQPQAAESGKMLPLAAFGIEVISFGTILKPGQPVMWRGPMLAKAMREFLYEVEWGPLDYLVIDLPPGTGDVADQPRPVHPAHRCGHRDHPAGRLHRRREPGHPDVHPAPPARPRGGREHERLHLPPLRGAHRRLRVGRRPRARRAQRPALPRRDTARPRGPGRRWRRSAADGGGPRIADGQDLPSVAEQIAAEISKENYAATGGPQMPSAPRIPVRG